MSMMGELNYFIGLQIKQTKNCIFVNQSKYFKELIKIFNIDTCKEISTPMGLNTYFDQDESSVLVDIIKYICMIGSLLYLMVSHPDIMFSVCLCACYQTCSKEYHITIVKRIMKCLKGTTNVELQYLKGNVCILVSFYDLDYARYKTDREKTNGMYHILENALVSWSYKKQACVTLSTVKAENIAAKSCYEQIPWLQKQLCNFSVNLGCIFLKCDNTSAINISKYMIMHLRIEHIDISHHFLRDFIVIGDVEISFINTHNQLADVFTKPLPKELLFKIRIPGFLYMSNNQDNV